MDYKLLYIEDNAAESRSKDLESIGYEVISHDPTPNIGDVLKKIDRSIDAIVLDYRLTNGANGANNACYDAPTIAQTLRTKHSKDNFDIPMVLMSNETTIVDYFNDFSSQDLFDFVLTKEEFTRDKIGFKNKLKSFILCYKSIKANGFDIAKILDIETKFIHPNVYAKLEGLKYKKEHSNAIFEYSSLIYYQIIEFTGMLIDEDVLSSRLGVSKDSNNWVQLLDSLGPFSYTGVFADIKKRWWMENVTNWWNETIDSKHSLRRLNAQERVDVLKSVLGLDIKPLDKTTHSISTNFWTVCKLSKMPLDPFDGIELLKDYLPWQEKEYLSFDSALVKLEDYKHLVSPIDKKAVRELVEKLNK